MENNTNKTYQKPKYDNGKYKCPNCNTELNNDELAACKCFSCNTSFRSSIKEHIDYDDSNDYDVSKTAFVIKGFAIFLFVIDIISSLVLVSYEYDSGVIFTFILISIFSFLLLFGIAEIIHLLYEINKKLK